ncbi:glycosyltransferase [Mangrovihabitans endophyticus]|uniref:Glycosyl transferase n=1 Tax=Mangrovihabitans endophyticus TaxID=1751298 RepID=A0A8J3C4E3_9ACTN|nr:glycosyltransferase [Mangrovihabitans endophyticus]GGL07862.1 glycosyl transferase [Mangrovihabitans endophyticus]
MRVLHVNKFLYRRGGAEAYLLDVAAMQRAAGDEVALFGMTHPDNDPGLPYARDFPSFVELEPPPPGAAARLAAASRMIWSRSARAGLDRVLAAFRPDVVHLHNVYHQLSPSVVAAVRAAGVPCVMTLHDYKLACPSYQMLDHGRPCDACLTGGVWQAARRSCKDGSRAASTLLSAESWLHRRLSAYRGVGVFLAPSRFLAHVMERAGVYPDRLRVLRHPARLPAAKTRAGGGVVFAGRLAPEKGVDVLLRAAADLPAGVPVDIAGDGPARPELERLAAGRARFHGRLDRDRLHALVRDAAVAAVPSRWYENQPLAVLEAFGCGVPVVGTDLGGLPELIEPGVDGEIVPAEDPAALVAALHRLTADPDRALRMGRAGRAKVGRDFDPGVHLDGLRAAYAAAAR